MEPGRPERRDRNVGERTDAELVLAARDGDREAFATIYDRYADRVHTMCRTVLRDPDEAADVTGDTFLTAAERIGQLRDPDRLRPWLFAIARRACWLRTRRRSRTVATDRHDDLEPTGAVVTGGAPTAAEVAVEAGELAALVRDAAGGLDERDRAVLALQLQGLEGADLADALGVEPRAAHLATHRMRERLERSLGALVVARAGRRDCADLDRLLSGWDGAVSVLWRKRVARHVDGCEVCGERRRKVPAVLLQGMAGATPVVAAPVSLRSTVLEGARLGGATGRAWPHDGFPPPGRRRPRATALVAAAAAVLLLAGTGLLALDRGGDATRLLAVGPATTTAPTTTPAAAEATTPTTAPAIAPTTAPTVPAGPPVDAPPTVRVPVPTTVPRATLPPVTAPPVQPPVTAAPTTTAVPTTTVPPDRGPPRVTLAGPTTGTCVGMTYRATAVDDRGVASVRLEWRDARRSGVLAMTGAGSTWSVVFRPGAVVSGPVELVAVATDTSGNVGRSPALTACPIVIR